jgi:RecA-family ATPase
MIYKTKSRLVVIDPLISFHSQNENDNVEIRKVLDILTGICDVTKTACLVIHHLGKTKMDGVFSGRGASALADWASNILLIDKEDKGGKDDGVLLNIKYLKSRNFIKCPPFDLEVSGELRWSGFFRQPGVGYKW